MKLKVKILSWSTGFPVAMVNEKTAKKLGVHGKDRVFIKYNHEKFSTIIDTIKKYVDEDEIAFSSELNERMFLQNGEIVNVSLSEAPKSLDYIKKKLNKHQLKKKEIEEIIKDVTNNSLSESEIAMFISGMYRNGMNFQETIYLINSILKFGKRLNLKGKFIVDKHSIGGIPANRTTPIIVSICAAAGLIFPKNSSRAITSAAGTADVIETLAKVEFSVEELKKIIKKTNACMVWGGALEIAPADARIIQIEKTLKIDPESQLLASIMAKKLAVGSRYILIDIPYGKNAKVSREKALHLKTKFEKLARHYRKKMKVVLTKGDEPIGNGIGPILEMIDVIKVLNRSEERPKDLEKKSIFLSAQIFELTGKTKKGKGEQLAGEILESGKAFEKFKEIITAQKGKMKKLIPGKFRKEIKANSSGKLIEIHNKKINFLARVCGCPEDKASGLYLHKHLGDKVKKGEIILTIYSESKVRLGEAVKCYNSEKPIKIR